MYHRLWQLSGGELQRVAFARALINSPGLLLADEPTGALDHKTSEILINLLIELNNEENVTLLVVTHSKDLAEKMDRVFLLEDGLLKGK
jgi:lipoprotein-releasing system ATP-binding protein